MQIDSKKWNKSPHFCTYLGHKERQILSAVRIKLTGEVHKSETGTKRSIFTGGI